MVGTRVFYDKKFLHKIICCGYLFESPRGGDAEAEAILIDSHNI